MSDLIIGGSLLFSEPDCPTREGEVVDTLEDIYNIPSPRVGMRVFVKDTKKSYIVTKLKEEEINGVLVPNAKVDDFKDSQPDVAGMNDAIQANATAIADEKNRAISAETILNDKIQNVYNGITTLNTTIINYNQRYGINNPVTKKEVIEDLLNKYTADKGTIVTYYAEDGWHTIQYKLNYYRPEQGKDESNWVEIVNEDAIKDIKDSIDNAYVKPEGGIPKNDLSTEVQEAINNLGEIADGSVTEDKLSFDVKNKLNTAYDKANLADTLFVNDGITFIQGGYDDKGNDFYPGTNAVATSLAFQPNGERITVNNGYVITRYFLIYNGEVADMDKINSNYYDTFDSAGTDDLGLRIEIRKSDNTAINASEYPNIVKSFIRKPVAWSASCDMNNFVCEGKYTISGSREANAQDNMPIYNGGKIEARLEVLESDNTLVQILTLLNIGGGDGNIYTRTRQDNTWGQWGKLQTNVEVGVINQQQMDALIDNGIYSGVLSTTGETFVIICINNYAIATQAGYGGYISHLKYSVGLDGVVKVETRRRDAFGSWTDWQSIGGGDTSVVNQTTTTATIAPNVLNVWGEVAQLDITLAEGKDNVVNEYMFQFTSGATATTLVLPADIKWVSAPNIQANKTYQVSIINNLGVIGEFSHE